MYGFGFATPAKATTLEALAAAIVISSEGLKPSSKASKNPYQKRCRHLELKGRKGA